MSDIMSPLYSKKENINIAKNGKFQFGYKNESNNKKRSKIKPIKIYLFNQKMNNLLLILQKIECNHFNKINNFF